MVDENAGKLTKLLRLAGFDTVFFNGADDADMLAAALAENRIVLTRDTQVMKRSVVTGGRIKAIFIENDSGELQMRQVISSLQLNRLLRPFTLCLECNRPLEPRDKEQIKDRVPPYVFKTQEQFVECPECHRIYWKGTHWQSMTESLTRINTTEE